MLCPAANHNQATVLYAATRSEVIRSMWIEVIRRVYPCEATFYQERRQPELHI